MDENKIDETELEDTTIIITDEEGNETPMEILFTFTDDATQKNYVLYFDPASDSGEVFASVYDEEGNLIQVTSEEEWKMIEEVFDAFNIEHEDEEGDEDDEEQEA
jgi:uncharacterized protein YrzB (UPF0473 family)